jgi:hypothetical protein
MVNSGALNQMVKKYYSKLLLTNWRLVMRTNIQEVIQVLKETSAIINHYNKPVSKEEADMICNSRIAMRGLL